MAIKKLSPDLIHAVEEEVRNWQFQTGEIKRLEHATIEWFNAYRRLAEIKHLIRAMTGLSELQTDSLLHQTATTAKYWKANGEIRRDY